MGPLAMATGRNGAREKRSLRAVLDIVVLRVAAGHGERMHAVRVMRESDWDWGLEDCSRKRRSGARGAEEGRQGSRVRG